VPTADRAKIRRPTLLRCSKGRGRRQRAAVVAPRRPSIDPTWGARGLPCPSPAR